MNLEYRSRNTAVDPYLFISNRDAVGRYEDVLVYYEEIAAVLNEGASETSSPDSTIKSTWKRNGSHMIIIQTCELEDGELDVTKLTVPIHELRTYLHNR